MAGQSSANGKTPPPGQKAASILGQPSVEVGKPAKQANIPSPGNTRTEILHQTRKFPFSPKMVISGFGIVVTIAYFTLYSKKKAEVTALDVAKVTTGIGSPGSNRRD